MDKSQIKRCAIYTRKSTDENLQDSFNSLDAQREAAEAYIPSQKMNGLRPGAERRRVQEHPPAPSETAPRLRSLAERVKIKEANNGAARPHKTKGT